MSRTLSLASLAVVCCLGSVAGASTSPSGTLIVAGPAKTWAMTPAGKRGRMVLPEAYGSVRVSPSSSTTVLAATEGRIGSGDVALLLFRGGREHVVEESADSPAWARDGHRFAYVAYRTFDCVNWYSQTIVVRSTRSLGTAARPAGAAACPDPWIDADPTWSPDGRQLAFHRLHERRPSRDGIYVVRIGRPGARKLAWGKSPAWSPDGRTIAFRRGAVLFTHDLRTGANTRRGSLGRVREDVRLHWSPDGTQVGYSLLDAGEAFVAATFDIRTGRVRRVAPGYRVLDWIR